MDGIDRIGLFSRIVGKYRQAVPAAEAVRSTQVCVMSPVFVEFSRPAEIILAPGIFRPVRQPSLRSIFVAPGNVPIHVPGIHVELVSRISDHGSRLFVRYGPPVLRGDEHRVHGCHQDPVITFPADFYDIPDASGYVPAFWRMDYADAPYLFR